MVQMMIHAGQLILVVMRIQHPALLLLQACQQHGLSWMTRTCSQLLGQQLLVSIRQVPPQLFFL